MRAAEERLRLILGGGTLAEGARRGADLTDEDRELEEALFYDGVAERYGWTPEVADSVPDALLANMLRVARIRSEAEQDRAQAQAQRMEASQGGGR